MKKNSKEEESSPVKKEVWTVIEDIARAGAQKMLQEAIENEVEEFIDRYRERRDKTGHRLVVRNGHMPEREVLSGVGPIRVKQPRVDDREIRKDPCTPEFTSNILPRYLRRFPSIDNLLPVLYLKGISTGDFPRALSSILGEDAKGLSAGNIVRLKGKWEKEYQEWAKRDLSGKRYMYFWADGIYFNARLEHEKSCILVIIGADEGGNKELVGLSDGFRESEQSWKELLLDLKARGLNCGPELTTGDGALGLWKAFKEMYPKGKRQRCWVHKTANILDKLPKSIQGKAKSMIHEMYLSPTKDKALRACDRFVETFEDKYPKAVDCLVKDKEDLFTFYDFPAAHWIHIRTTNPIESTFATVRLRTRRTKGCGSRLATFTMVWKLVLESQKTWHRIKGYRFIPFVIKGLRFVDGKLVEAA